MLFTSEQVSKGHPDKICDQISDAILTEHLLHDKDSRVAVETLIKNYDVIIAGEVTSSAKINYHSIMRDVLQRVGLENVSKYVLVNLIDKQSKDIAQGVDTGGAGDQGIMFGYATNETPEMLPIPYVLATRALQKLDERNHPLLKADAKAQVTFDYENNRIDTFLISVQHDEKMHPDDLKSVVVRVMSETAMEYGLNIDFKPLVNPTGRFVIGSSFADAGVTGRKIIADTYGGKARHGGGAFSGKDPSKVDRSAAYMARKIAKNLVRLEMCDECEVQIGYAIGVAEPVSVYINTYGTEHAPMRNLYEHVETYNLTPKAIIEQLDLLNVDYRQTSTYGHFMNGDMPWEK